MRQWAKRLWSDHQKPLIIAMIVVALAGMLASHLPFWIGTALCAGAIVLALLSSLVTARATARHVAHLTEVVRKFAGGELDARMPAGRDDDLGHLGQAFNAMANHLVDFTNDLERNVALLSIVEEENRRVATAITTSDLFNVVEQGLLRLQQAMGCWLSLYVVDAYDGAAGEIKLQGLEGKQKRSLPRDAAFSAHGDVSLYVCHLNATQAELEPRELWRGTPAIVREGAHFVRDYDKRTADRILRAYALAVAGAIRVAETIELQARHVRVSAEIEAARAVQEGLLPQQIALESMKAVALYQPANHIGGDWYGHYLDRPNDIAYYYIGDITGHGFSSAVLTGVVFGAVQAANSFLSSKESLGRQVETPQRHLAEILNQTILRSGMGRLMMTFMAIGVDLRTGEVCCLNAGHRHGIWVQRQQGSVTAMTGHPSPILGYEAASAAKFRCSSLRIEKGDVLCMFTDGLVENRTGTGQRMKMRDLKQTLLSAPSLEHAEAGIKRLTDAFWSARKGEDDATLLLLQWCA
jgi:serine phosphatase RsbU (regulator of sigma subunit)/HAMP domain-containing protein